MNSVYISMAGYALIFIAWTITTAITPQQAIIPGQPLPPKAPSWRQFYDESGIFLVIWAAIVTVLFFVSAMKNSKLGKDEKLRKSQRERIRILESFAPTTSMKEFFDDRSIYTTIIAMFDRLLKEEETGNDSSKYEICMLLCSPALDYWKNENSKSPEGNFEWGLEFRNKVNELAAKESIKFEICHLPLESFSGLNPMKDFISVLANYTTNHSTDFAKSFTTLWERSKRVADDFSLWSVDHDRKHRFSVITNNTNIPFQAIIINSVNFTEVVVSFAGREVLEREHKYDIKGFFSSDPYVVKTFHSIFKTYIQSKERIPFIPLHTLNIADKHSRAGHHLIPNYYYGKIRNLHVHPETFSPCIGNSTKFTVWVIDKLLTTLCTQNSQKQSLKIKKILDIGAGTGILALTASATLRSLKKKDYSITALDACQHAQNILKLNCAQDNNIKHFPWSLSFSSNDKSTITNAYFKDEKDSEIKISGDFCEFDLVIADLPFVHAVERSKSDLRFLDHRHQLHQAFFKVCSETKLISDEGIIITAFSSLGGPDDIHEFESYIHKNSLQAIQRVEFFEDGYAWIVYVLMRINTIKKHADRFWWTQLDANNYKKESPTGEASKG